MNQILRRTIATFSTLFKCDASAHATLNDTPNQPRGIQLFFIHNASRLFEELSCSINSIYTVDSFLRHRLQALLEILHPLKLALREDLTAGIEVVSALQQQRADDDLFRHGVLVVVDMRGAGRAEEATHVLA